MAALIKNIRRKVEDGRLLTRAENRRLIEEIDRLYAVGNGLQRTANVYPPIAARQFIVG